MPNTINWIAIGGSVVGIAVAIGVGGIMIKFLLSKGEKVFLQGSDLKLPLRLVDKEAISPDTSIYTFGITSNECVLGLPIGNCVRLHARINGEDIVRPYTPITLDDLKGYTKFIIKTYRKNIDPQFPNGGKMTQYLDSMDIGDGIDVSGPFGVIKYLGKGSFEVTGANARKLKATRINMICGGTGLTPIYQILKHILASTSDNTKLSLIFANRTEKDILVRDELEQLKDRNSNQLRLWYTLESPPASWAYGVGYVDQQMLGEHAFPAAEDTVNLLCGPPAMMQYSCFPILTAAGHKKDNILTF